MSFLSPFRSHPPQFASSTGQKALAIQLQNINRSCQCGGKIHVAECKAESASIKDMMFERSKSPDKRTPVRLSSIIVYCKCMLQELVKQMTLTGFLKLKEVVILRCFLWSLAPFEVGQNTLPRRGLKAAVGNRRFVQPIINTSRKAGDVASQARPRPFRRMSGAQLVHSQSASKTLPRHRLGCFQQMRAGPFALEREQGWTPNRSI